ncbi:hypothetical protein ANN_11001 [Periplaneta americana]|uniref:Uncharacterized protein n=1 Tax=Periplaneta americana TaxID=6978 RepID=A0ABQ8T640_PERAM|nr:hypothetical protein ANN_11001 [Periplaneta americana]
MDHMRRLKWLTVGLVDQDMAEGLVYRWHLSAGAAYFPQKLQELQLVDRGSVAPLDRWRLCESRNQRRLDDYARPERPKTSTPEQSLKLVANALQENRRATCEELSEATGSSLNSVFRILTKNLKKRKFSARWVPHRLTAEQKQKRLDIANLLTGPSRKRIAQRCTVSSPQTSLKELYKCGFLWGLLPRKDSIFALQSSQYPRHV